MSGFTIKKAEKKKRKLRLALVGASKSGKTLTMLKFLRALVGPNGRIGVVTTEGDNCQIYAGAEGVGEFDMIVLDEFNPQTYIDAMGAFVKAGYDAVGIDSLSHAWMGKGGCLEIVDSSSGSNKFSSGWSKATPLHNELISAINHCPVHLIATMRQKVDYVIETGANGKQTPKKVGMAAVQRDGMEYEFDITGTMEHAELTVDGIRGTELESLVGKTFRKPGEDFIGKIVAFLDDSKAPTPQTPPANAVTPAPKDDTYSKAHAAIMGAKSADFLQKVADKLMIRVQEGELSQEDGSTLLALCESQQAALGIKQKEPAPI
jgi:hypothetical protein